MREYAVIDIETTGGNSENHRIIEIAVFVHDGNRIIDEYETLINPERKIPAYIEGFTGITNEMVKDAPVFRDIAEKLEEITAGRVFVAHNVNFDYGFIRKEFNLRLSEAAVRRRHEHKIPQLVPAIHKCIPSRHDHRTQRCYVR